MKTLNEILEKAAGKGRARLVVAAAEDEHVLDAVSMAMSKGIIEAILIGNVQKINEIAIRHHFDFSTCEIIEENDPVKASFLAVQFISQGKAEILMKGLVGTADLLKAVLNKENGLKKSEVLSHVSVFETPYYHKLLGISDVAMNIAPELKEKVAIIQNAVEVFHGLGVSCPKVAVLGAVELVNPAMPATLDAAILTMMNRRKQIKNCLIDGPLALDNAVSSESAKIKGIESEVAGDADILICNDIESGNFLYKSLNFLGGAAVAAVIMGAKVPVVLTSRADTEKSKLMSIALAAILR
ncbi:MAG TPA: bifunctional enoyl-CoA hydratase/phosphate acetyltransferase [Bacteroidia bacterium]|nr:bifunctional enoyl-CoA hydratase/phosphate acetyltransferase [Bacteroidia bacterium]HRS59497.1 bifunctional enoyl-CoA hydratase/phosphate acetyltransferase [Bacteroidia bacterium]HRU67611.1 bifunctional enoyl-CoA hydratase/phosphate acetyltransferase [Bacteroidia bacterium]